MKDTTYKRLFFICKVKYLIRKATRKIKRKLSVKSNPKSTKFGKSFLDIYDVQCKIFDLITSNEPFMVGRMGGVEGAAVLAAIQVKKGWKKSIDETIANNAYINAGFFPPTCDKLMAFSDLMEDSLKQVDILGSMSTNDEEFLVRMNASDTCILTNIGNLEPYYCDVPWTKALKGKKVLVIYPFADTIYNQYQKREKLFENPDILPEFDLKVMKAVQSIAGTKTEFKDWFEALDYMFTQAMMIDFDIAIIGCGAYGFPLAAKLKQAGKQAIHLGGATQILFGIKGDRWEHIPAVKNLFNEYWVRPSAEETPKGANKVEGGCYW